METQTRHPRRPDDPLVSALVQNRPLLIRIAARILASRDQAEDVVQDATLKACAGSVTCPECPLNFACRMVRNLAVDRVRQQQCERRIILAESGAVDVPSAAAGADRRLEDCEALAIAVKALDDLPERTRNAFLRHRLDGVQQKLIAIELGVSPTLVNFLIRAAHEHCRSAIGASEQRRQRSSAIAGRKLPNPDPLAPGAVRHATRRHGKHGAPPSHG